jgi:hypothetical protein
VGNVPFIGLIKEVGPQDDESIGKDELGTRLFQEKFYNYPLYLDKKLDFYNAMGNRKIYSLFNWNPFTWWSSLMEMSKRSDDRGIPGNLKGEGIILGGVLVISKTKGVVYQYQEQTGSPIPVDDIAEAVNEALKE